MITILSDPIAQQLVHYGDCQRLVSQSSASILRANAYSNGGAANEAPLDGPLLITIASDMQGASIAGVYSTEAASIPFECSTGNCTVPSTFRTLGYCSRCSDVGKELRIILVKAELPNVALPSGLIVIPRPATYAMSWTQLDSPCTEIINASGLMINPHCNAGNTSWPCLPYAAARCYLYPCVKTFSATVSGGDLECVDNQQRQSLLSEGYNFSNTTKYLPYNVSYDHDYSKDRWTSVSSAKPLSNATLQIVPPKCIYSESTVTEESLAVFFDNFFTGNMSMGPTADVQPDRVVEQIFIAGITTFEGISDIFRNISRAMTTVMRTTGAERRSDRYRPSLPHGDLC